jgi:excisionase family DNA binding protein
MENLLSTAKAATRPEDERLDTAQAADYLGVQQHTLEIWRSSGRYRIPYIKVGKLIRYRRSALDDWMESRTVNAASGG